MKFNKNYHHNTKHNSKKIKQIVAKLMERKSYPAPADFLFRFNARRYPISNHKVLELPGKFKNIEDTRVFVKDNGVLDMDFCQSVFPDGHMILRESALNLEHQSRSLPFEKVQKIFDYCFYKAIELEKPCYPIVVTNGDYPPQKLYCLEGIPFLIRFIVFDEDRICKILNTLSKKDYNQEVFSNEDYLNLVYCIIFCKKPYEKDVIQKAAYIFASIDNIGHNHQLGLHLALTKMIKYYFDDDKKIEELLTMITKAVHDSSVDEISSYEVKVKSNEELKEEIYQKNEVISQQGEVISQQGEMLSQKDEKISQQDEMLSQKDEEISQMSDEISKKDSEIKKLKRVILENNIIL